MALAQLTAVSAKTLPNGSATKQKKPMKLLWKNLSPSMPKPSSAAPTYSAKMSAVSGHIEFIMVQGPVDTTMKVILPNQ